MAALLKSAWEIALERTEGIEADPEKIRKEASINKGRKLAGTYLANLEDDGSDLKKTYEKADENLQPLLKAGLGTTVIMNIALPQTTDYENRIEKMIFIASTIDGPQSLSVDLLGQVGQFMGKYVEARDSLLERARQQYAPVYEQKREREMQQYGRSSNIPLDQDPEFLQLLQKSFAQLSAQFQQALDEVKDELRKEWNLQ
ncbi:MAG: DUF6657 family protein [Sphaerochaetaceae bacterium]